jgi:hypothetical protein
MGCPIIQQRANQVDKREDVGYKENKAKVFFIIEGQCTYHMVNKIKSDKDYKALEENDDMIGLLTIIKELIYNTRSVQYHYWTGRNIICEILMYKQSCPSQNLIAFYKKWKSGVDMLETQACLFLLSQGLQAIWEGNQGA